MAEEEVRDQPSGEQQDEHHGGGRFNQRLIYVIAIVAMTAGVAGVHGIRSAAVKTIIPPQQSDESADATRDQAKVEELAAAAVRPTPAPVLAAPVPISPPKMQAQTEPREPKTPSRYAQWAEDKYLRALEAPQMVSAFHGANAVEVSRTSMAAGQGGAAPSASFSFSSNEPNVRLQPPVSPYMVMAGSVIPAVLVSGINSDLPGSLVAQVSENVFDSASGKRLLIPQGSRLIGTYRNASSYGQQRVQVAWQRLIFPNTASMELPQMPGADQHGYSGFTDEVNNHYLATFGTAAVMSLISAGQTVGQLAAFGGGGTYGPAGYYQPNQWAMAGESAGAGASGQLGSVGQQVIGQGLNRPSTIEIRPGYQFAVMVTEDLVFPGPFRN